MSDETIFYSSDLSNSKHVGLFDRIINIKFIRKDGTYFTLHSDYEPMWANGSLFFKPCQPKPEIRVTYTQYQGTMINVDIFVTNLNIKESPDQTLKDAQVISNLSAVSADIRQGNTTNQPNDVLSSKGNIITKAIIEMGYRGDFYNWSRYREKYSGKEAEVYDAYQNLEGLDRFSTPLSDTQLLFGKHRRCVVTIEWAVNISNPPDRVTQFHGYVGNSEAGFQPFAGLTLDCPSEEGTVAKITKNDLYRSLNDQYSDIDEVETGDPVSDDARSLITSPKGYTYRNFFNGGRGFTLLEAICFTYVTRRFIRSNINAERNSTLERVYLQYLEDTEGSFSASLAAYRDAMEQRVYSREKEYDASYFVELDGKLAFAPAVSADIRKAFKETVDSLLIEQLVGARYTIKNLPDYRKLYRTYREAIAEAHKMKRYMSWWDAAEKVSTKNMKEAENRLQNKIVTADKKDTYTATSAEIANSEDGFKGYLLDMQNGSLANVDTYIKKTAASFGDDWIIPIENIKSKIVLKDSKGKKVTGKMPQKASTKGFSDPGPEVPLPCFTGFFEVRDAYMFGTIVICTDKASRKVQSKLSRNDFIDIPFLPQAHSQVAWLCKTYGLLMYKMNNGGYLLYEESEDAREMGKQSFIRNQSDRAVKIPAIYDMTLSPVRKMRIPFIGFLDPMSRIEWNSTNTIGSMISYYYQPEKGKNYFLNISNTVDFCTTGDTNVMELSLVDTQYTDETEVPAVLTDKNKKESEKNVYSQVIIDITDDTQFDTWRKIYDSFLSVIPFALLDKWGVKNTGRDRSVAYQNFFLAMKEWNKTLFGLSTEPANGWSVADGKKRVDKWANWLYGGERTDKKVNFPEIRYCFENAPISDRLQRIYMKYPIMPDVTSDYNSMKEVDDERIFYYSKGEWSMQLKVKVKQNFDIGEN